MNNWILCENELPANDQECLITWCDNVHYATMTDWGWETPDYEILPEDRPVIAWMPLPEPYKSK